MRVCIITPRYPPNKKGGGEISCSVLARELSKYIDVDVISFDGNITSQSEVDGVRVIRKKPITSHKVKTPINLQAYLFLKKKINDYDVFHTYNMDLMPAVGLLTKLHKIKSVATLNGAVYSSSQGGWYQAYKNSFNPKVKLVGAFIIARNKLMIPTIRNINVFTTLCPFYKEKFVEDGIPSEKIQIIPNMIDRNFVPSEKEKSRNVRMFYIGNFGWRKGMDILISAYSMLEEQDVELTIAGYGGYGMDKEKIVDLINRLNPKNRVDLIDVVPYEEVPVLYSETDVFIQPYRYPEPIGRTLIEALRSGVSVITTGTDYYSPIIRDMKDGVLVYPCTAEKLSEKMQMLIDKPYLRERLAKSGQNRVVEVCAPDKIVREYIRIYEEQGRRIFPSNPSVAGLDAG